MKPSSAGRRMRTRARHRGVTVHEKADIGMGARKNIDAFDDDIRRGIAAHSVNGKNEAVRHLA